MRASHVLYEAPAGFDDLIEVFVRTKRIDDALMCTAEQTLVLVDLSERRPHPVPDDYRDVVVTFEGADLELAVPS
jgi:acyl-CoA thioesterase FadM